MKITLIALLSLLLVPAVFAQHSVTLSFVPSPTPGVASYNVYRAPCTGTVAGTVCSGEGTFAKIGSVAAGVANAYTDTTVAAGGLYSYYMTSVCPTAGCSASMTGESIGSTPHVGVIVPKDTPLPPTGVSITTVSRNSTGANTTLSASYTAAPNSQTRYTFRSGNQVLASNVLTNASGVYVASWAGKLKPGSPVVFQVCDAAASCDSRTL